MTLCAPQLPALLRVCLFILLFTGFTLADNNATIQAVVVLKGTTAVTGTVYFTQDMYTNATSIKGTVQGLDANSSRGFHIHTFGNLTDGCNSTGTHYNPFNKSHGGPMDTERHVGDLGNIQADLYGTANINLVDYQVQLTGPFSVVGRGVVVHTGTDDLGKLDNEGSHTTGNAGARAACGVIGLA